MTFRKQLAVTTALLALSPFAAQAALIVDNWTGSGADSNWTTAGNWDNGVPGTNYTVNINVAAKNPVQITTGVLLNVATTTGPTPRPTASLTIGSAESVNIGTGGSLTMGTHTITLNGGTLSASGTGAISTTGQITGNGTLSGLTMTSGTLISSGGALNLTNDTFSGITLGINSGSGGVFNITGDSFNGVTLGQASSQVNLNSNTTFTGAINRNNTVTFNTNANTLSLKSSPVGGTTGGNIFNIVTGGVLDNAAGNSSVANSGTTLLAGGKITNSGGGSFTFNDPITGFGTISGPITINDGVSASGGLLTVDGTSGAITVGPTGFAASAGSTLDMKGTFNYPGTGGFLNPGGGTVQLDGATLNNAGNTIYTGTGSIIANSGVNTLNSAMIYSTISTTQVPSYTVKNGATLSVSNTNALNNAIWSNNFAMENNSKLSVAGVNKTFNLAGSFMFAQTDRVNAWTNGGTMGLGPDLLMTGGTSATPVTLEVGSANLGGYNPAAYVQNFALDSLTVGRAGTNPPAYVDLVDQSSNTTGAGTEILYLDALEGLPSTGPIGTLNLDGITAYVMGHGFLFNGLYVAPDGSEVNIIGANTTPEPATLALFGTGLLGLGLVRRRRRS